MKTGATFTTMLAALFVVAASGCGAVDHSRASTAIAITGATIIDGTGQSAIRRGTIVVVGDRIVAVGPSEQVKVPAEAQIVKADGRYLMPGMIDLHSHFWESGRPGAQPTYVVDLTDVFSWQDEITWVKQRIPYTLTRYACAGVTTVVALGGIGWEYEVRDLAKRTAKAPRVLIAGGFVGNVRPAEGSPQWEGEQTGYWIDHPDDAPTLIAGFQAKNVDLIKAGYVAGRGLSLQRFAPALTALTREAHARALRVSVHANELDAAKAALRAEADILAHTVRDTQLDEEFLALAKTSHVINTTTIGLPSGFFRAFYEPANLSEADQSCGDPEVIESWKRWESLSPVNRPPLPAWIAQWKQPQQHMLGNIRALHQAGIRIAVGSDGGNIGSMHGAAFHKELHLLAEAGLPPMAIIAAATRHGAEALGLEKELGTLEVGKVADLVALDADPLADVANINRIAYVMLRGKLFSRRELNSF